MANWEYEIVIGGADEVKEQLNRLGALGWEIAATDVLPSSAGQATLLVYLKRGLEPEAPEPPQVSAGDFPVFRPGT